MKALNGIRVSILCEVNVLLAAIGRNASVPGLNVDFSSKLRSMKLHGLFLSCDVRAMLGGNDYRAVHMIFQVIRIYLYRAAWFQNEANMTGAHVINSDMLSKAVSQNYG